MSTSPYTAEWKAMVSQEYLSGAASSYELSFKHNVGAKTIRCWALRYKEQGISAFKRGCGNSTYTNELKLECVELYLSGKLSRDEIVAKYNLSGHSVLKNWIMKYNANRELKDYNPKREVYMAEARRKTTVNERKKIVEYCINHNHDYKDTASTFDVSYSQVYSWVRKYQINGEESLIDKRGHHKTYEEVDELERLRRENLHLKRQLKESEMANQLLKKVRELERM